jgi:hypothetical protein
MIELSANQASLFTLASFETKTNKILWIKNMNNPMDGERGRERGNHREK